MVVAGVPSRVGVVAPVATELSESLSLILRALLTLAFDFLLWRLIRGILSVFECGIVLKMRE
jgi:hypothetical protein